MSERGAWQSVFDRVEVAIRAGAIDEGRLDEELTEWCLAEVGAPDDTTSAELLKFARGLLASERAAEVDWREPTANDRIDRAFEELDAAGIVSLQNAGTTISDGWADVNRIATSRARGGDVPRGAVFFHEQDAARGVAGKGLLLAFGAYEEDATKKLAAERSVAHEIVATLKRHGVDASWDGTVDSRISIAPFRWQKRRSTTAPPQSSPPPDSAETHGEQARQIVEGLVEGELLELVSASSRSTLEAALEIELVEPPPTLDELAEQLLGWFVEQHVVAEIFADHDALKAILESVTPPIM